MRRSVELEAARWLAERQYETDPTEHRWRDLGVRWSSWVPSLMVLLVFLFLPEIWGILSHVNQPPGGKLHGYRVHIPVTWIILDSGDNPVDDVSWVGGLAGQGMGRGVTSYLHAEFPLSSWNIETEPYDPSNEPTMRHRLPKAEEVIGQRVFRIGNESVTCLEYWPSYLIRPKHVEDSSLAFVECSSTGRLYASILGRRSDLPAFYKMLDGVAQIVP